jgi:hypothetical protein
LPIVCEKNRSAAGEAILAALHSAVNLVANGVMRAVVETDLEAEAADLRAARRRECILNKR